MKTARSFLKPLLTQSLLQAGFLAIIALGMMAVVGCARKNTNPPGAPGGDASLLAQQAQAGAAAIEPEAAPSTQTKAIKNGDQLLAMILRDKELIAFLRAYQKANQVVCTAPSSGQIHWNCKSATQCSFALESTCVSNIDGARSNDELRRLSIVGEGNSAKMTYKLQNPAQTAAESKVVKVKFEY